MTPREIQRRALTLLFLVSLTFGGLLFQLGNLQFRQRATFSATAESNHTRNLVTFAPRGVIYDRNRLRMADSRLAYSVVVSYDAFDNTSVLRRLADALHVNYNKLRQAVTERKESGHFYEPVEVKSDLTPEEHTWIAEHKDDLPGVFVLHQPVRDYLMGATAGHVLGYVRVADAADVAKRKLSPLDTVGKLGLEAFYDDVIRGKDGQQVVEVDAAARPLGIAKTVLPTRGDSLVLTLDSRLQADTERALDYVMWQIRNRVDNDGHIYKKATRGAAVMMDIKTGEILAMASLPGYDPNAYIRNDDKVIGSLQIDPLSPMWNRAIGGEYQPGSTFKLVTTVAAFTEGIADANRRVFCSGHYEIGNKECWTWRTGGHGWTDIYKAIAESCDIYYYQMGRELGIDRLAEYMADMGLGKPTGIDLKEEEAGQIPSAAWRDARASAKENSLVWQLGDTLSAAIGQIVTVTPLQLAQYTAWVANGGLKVRPHLVKEILDANSDLKQTIQPEADGRVKASPETLSILHEAMKLTPFGAGTAADGWWERFPIKVAAKTGTSENPPHDEYGTWIGFAPADDPQVALAIVVEEVGHGSSLTPIARAMFASYFKVPVDKRDPAFIPADWVVGADPAPKKSGQ